MQPHVSIIIPVYNASKTLQTTVASLQAQTLRNWECIFVNDGSKDTSEEMLEVLIRNDCRIKGIHQPNHGVSSARNRGIDKIFGETLFFLDADDALTPSCLKTLYDYQKTTYANWCSCNIAVYQNNIFETLRLPEVDALILRKDFITSTNLIDTWVVWAKLFDAAWFKAKNLKFNTSLRVAEDSLLMTQAVCRADKIAHLGSCHGYCYFNFSSVESLMQKSSTIYPSMRVYAFERLLEEPNAKDLIVQFYQRQWLRVILQQTLLCLKQGAWPSLAFPSRFSLKSWKIALRSPKHLLGWSALFVLKYLVQKIK